MPAFQLTTLSQSSLQDYVDCARRFQLRYVDRLAYPAIESEPALENEQHQREGEFFHRLAQQYLVGIPSEQVSKLANTPNLQRWWENFLAEPDLRGLKDLGGLAPEAKLGWHIIIATVPALVAGYLLRDTVEALFNQPMLQASIRLFSAAILLTLAELLTKKNRNLESMTWLDALVIGLFQIIAVFPGASRSGTTISGGMFRGFDRPSAARFAFLMSVPVMLAAGGYEMLDVMKMPNLSEFLPLLAVGFVTAALVGWFAIKWLIDYLSKRSLYVFAVYCAILGVITLSMS